MSSFDARQCAANRGLEDAKAANALTQASGQTLVLINGGAATATLTFFAAILAAAKTSPPPIDIPVSTLACSLFCFALGVVSGAYMIGCQGRSVQYWSQYWDSFAEMDDVSRRSNFAEDGHRYNVKVGLSFNFGVFVFVAGFAIISLSLAGLDFSQIGGFLLAKIRGA